MANSRKRGRHDSIKQQCTTPYIFYISYVWVEKDLCKGGVVSGSKGYLSVQNSVYLCSNLNAAEFAMTGVFWFLLSYMFESGPTSPGECFPWSFTMQPSLGCCVKQNFQWTSVNLGGATRDWLHAHVRSKGVSHVTIASSGRIRNFNMEPIIGTGNYIHNTALTLWHHSIAQKLKHDDSLTAV